MKANANQKPLSTQNIPFNVSYQIEKESKGRLLNYGRGIPKVAAEQASPTASDAHRCPYHKLAPHPTWAATQHSQQKSQGLRKEPC